MKIQIDCYRKLGNSELDELKFIARHMKRFGISKQWTGDGDLFNCGGSFVFHDYDYGLDLSTAVTRFLINPTLLFIGTTITAVYIQDIMI